MKNESELPSEPAPAGRALAPRRSLFVRLSIIISLGVVAGVAIQAYRESKRPERAPRSVQNEGRRRIRTVLEQIAASPVGQSKRWQVICDRVRALLESGDVVFTHEIKPQGMFRSEVSGPAYLYVKVLRDGDGRYTYMPLDQIAEAVTHETIHAIKTDRSSIEEECDGYAAGLTAGLVLRGETISTPLTIDGKPAAQFILRAYRDLPRDPEYLPVGQTRQWLQTQTGLE